MRKLLSTTIAVGIFASMGMTPVLADVLPNTLPTYNPTGSSNVTVSDPYTAANGRYTMDVTVGNGQYYETGVANYDDFNIGSNSTFNILFTNHNQTSINKVAATGGLSQIYGQFKAGSADNCGGVCNFQSTGKVILLNPNGILFGSGANVNINSFTASNLHGTYVEDERTGWEGYGTLQLRKYNDGEVTYTNDRIDGIKVEDGATITAGTNLTFAASNIDLYEGSKITTNTTTPNVTFVNNQPTEAFGKTYLVTSDGVNFTYQRHGGIRKMENTAADSANAMKIAMNGEIETGALKAYNYSANKNSEINTNGATIKAVKASKGNDGSVYLESDSRVISDNTTFTVGGDLTAKAKQKIQFNNGSKINADGNVTLETTTVGNNESYTRENPDSSTSTYTNDGTLIISNSEINANNISLKSPKAVSIQSGSKIKGANVTADGGALGYVVGASKVDADNFTISANDIWFDRADIKAAQKISATAKTGNILSMDNTGNGAESSFDAPEIELTATAGDIINSKTINSTEFKGSYNFNNKKATLNAGRDIKVNVSGVENDAYGLTAVAGRDVSIETPGTLSVSKLVAGNGDAYTTGDMTIKAANVKAGQPYAGNDYIITDADDANYDRSLISVKKGTFSSQNPNGTEATYYVTKSTDKIGDSDNYMRHHLQYGATSDSEKFVLLNPRADRTPRIPEEPQQPQPQQVVASASIPSVNDGLVTKNKLPRQTEVYNNNTSIINNRVALVDVFAAASQIEIEDDEE